MKRTIILVICLLMVLSIFVGCKNDGNSAQPTTEPTKSIESEKEQTEEETTEKMVNEYGWEVNEETLVISGFFGKFDPNEFETNTVWMNEFLLDEFNVVFEASVCETTVQEHLSLLLVSGDYPEVLTSLNQSEVKQWANQKKALELTDLIAEYGQNIPFQMGQYYYRILEDDGSVYGLPTYWGKNELTPDRSANYRYDWWLDIGSPEIKTTDDFYDAVVAMWENYKETEDGVPTYILSGYDSFKTGRGALQGFWGLKLDWLDNGDSLTHWVNTTQGKELTKYLNRFSLIGGLDPNMFAQTIEDYHSTFSSERVVADIGSWWRVLWAGVWERDESDVPAEETFKQVAIKAPGVDQVYLNGVNTTGSRYSIMTDKAEEEKQKDVMKWWNFCITDNGTKLFGGGVPNRTEPYESIWKLNDKGEGVFTEYIIEKMTSGTYDFNESAELGRNKYTMLAGASPMDDGTVVYFDMNKELSADWRNNMMESLGPAIYDATAIRSIKFEPEDQITIIKQQVEDVINAEWPKVVMSEEGEFDANWDAFVQKVKDAGLDEYEEYTSNECQELKAKWASFN